MATTCGSWIQSRIQQPDNERSQSYSHYSEDQEKQRKDADYIQSIFDLSITIFLDPDIVVQRNKCCGECTFTKQTAEEVGDIVSYIESVIEPASAKEKGHYLISYQSQYAAYEYRDTHHADIFSEALVAHVQGRIRFLSLIKRL
jgi:hypothetical protein